MTLQVTKLIPGSKVSIILCIQQNYCSLVILYKPASKEISENMFKMRVSTVM